MSETVLGDVASRCYSTWLLSLPTWGVDVDGLACPCTSYSLRPSDEGTMPSARCCLVPSLQWSGGAFPGDVKSPGLDISWSIDRVDVCIIESYME
jgi:hypothetical protein